MRVIISMLSEMDQQRCCLARDALILNRRQEDATMVSMAVDELDVGCGDFKVVEPASLVEKYERQ